MKFSEIVQPQQHGEFLTEFKLRSFCECFQLTGFLLENRTDKWNGVEFECSRARG